MPRILAFDREVRERAALRVEPLELGVALFTPAFPHAWDLNALWLMRGAPTAAELTALAEDVQGSAGLAHRRILVDEEALGAALAPEMRARGWHVTRFLFMTLEGPEPPGPAVAAEEVDAPTMRNLEARVLREDQVVAGEDIVCDLIGAREAMAAGTRARYFVAGDAATCTLRIHGSIAQVDEVGTLTAARGRGLGTATVRAAIAAAREEGVATTFLVADDEDWPKEWYARLGFVPAARTYAFTGRP